ncbi:MULTISPECIES: YeeE/YedE family protein [Mesorhizobium]|jgi:uncharacterized protein
MVSSRAKTRIDRSSKAGIAMTNFTPLQSLLGGALIGLSAVLLMALHGRIAGMTGILTGVIPPLSPEWRWRAAFLAGAVAAPLLYQAAGGHIALSVPMPTLALVGGGFLVGIGVHFGGGCPSGHGICGIARLSPRSMVAVATFMVAAFATVFIIRHVIGG